MRVKASISVKKREGYIFRLHESEPEGFPKKFKVNFEEFNYYDGEDDQIIVVEDSSIESDISKIDDDNFEATFNSDFYFEISDEKFEEFLEINNSQGIDYSIYLSSVEGEIELYSDDDWEFVENTNVELFNIEANK
tara:strand:- start:141 stop:548 length:408 start_codon:yes stop_codon:yes gene_type:complete